MAIRFNDANQELEWVVPVSMLVKKEPEPKIIYTFVLYRPNGYAMCMGHKMSEEDSECKVLSFTNRDMAIQQVSRLLLENKYEALKDEAAFLLDLLKGSIASDEDKAEVNEDFDIDFDKLYEKIRKLA